MENAVKRRKSVILPTSSADQLNTRREEVLSFLHKGKAVNRMKVTSILFWQVQMKEPMVLALWNGYVFSGAVSPILEHTHTHPMLLETHKAHRPRALLAQWLESSIAG